MRQFEGGNLVGTSPDSCLFPVAKPRRYCAEAQMRTRSRGRKLSIAFHSLTLRPRPEGAIPNESIARDLT